MHWTGLGVFVWSRIAIAVVWLDVIDKKKIEDVMSALSVMLDLLVVGGVWFLLRYFGM